MVKLALLYLSNLHFSNNFDEDK